MIPDKDTKKRFADSFLESIYDLAVNQVDYENSYHENELPPAGGGSRKMLADSFLENIYDVAIN